jgi:hypothetical protein
VLQVAFDLTVDLGLFVPEHVGSRAFCNSKSTGAGCGALACLWGHCLAAVSDLTWTSRIYNYAFGVIHVFGDCACAWQCLHQKWARLVGLYLSTRTAPQVYSFG